MGNLFSKPKIVVKSIKVDKAWKLFKDKDVRVFEWQPLSNKNRLIKQEDIKKLLKQMNNSGANGKFRIVMDKKNYEDFKDSSSKDCLKKVVETKFPEHHILDMKYYKALEPYYLSYYKEQKKLQDMQKEYKLLDKKMLKEEKKDYTSLLYEEDTVNRQIKILDQQEKTWELYKKKCGEKIKQLRKQKQDRSIGIRMNGDFNSLSQKDRKKYIDKLVKAIDDHIDVLVYENYGSDKKKFQQMKRDLHKHMRYQQTYNLQSDIGLCQGSIWIVIKDIVLRIIRYLFSAWVIKKIVESFTKNGGKGCVEFLSQREDNLDRIRMNFQLNPRQ